MPMGGTRGLTRRELERLLEPLADELGYELVQVQASRTRRFHVFRVFVDKENGVNISDCAFLSRRVGQILDQDPLLVGAYSLDVSSPGMNRPIWSLDHYRRFQGEKVHILLRDSLDGRRRWTGRIAGVAREEVAIDLEGPGERRFRLDEIEEARLELDPWKAPKADRSQ
jgi:ribosome maturation factor RimP